jgi:uncharacterized OB-fold protein
MSEIRVTSAASELLESDEYVKAFPETMPFWASAENGILVLPSCDNCHRVHWHPRAFCPHCHSSRLSWCASPGLGEIHAYSVVRRPGRPYIFGYVRLDEGLILMTNIVDCALERIRIGLPVSVTFSRTEQGRLAPFFRPRADQGECE